MYVYSRVYTPTAENTNCGFWIEIVHVFRNECVRVCVRVWVCLSCCVQLTHNQISKIKFAVMEPKIG